MEILIAAPDVSQAQRVAEAVQPDAACVVKRLTSFDTACTVAESHAGPAVLVIFFVGARFDGDEIAILRRLCNCRRDAVKVVALGTNKDAEKILEVIRCGAIDYLDLGGNLGGAIQAVKDRILNLERSRRKSGRLFSVVSPVGGSGGSFLACNIAAALAQKTKHCGLIDLHLRGGDLAQLLNMAPQHSLASLAAKAHELDAAMFERSLATHECGIQLLAGPELLSDYRKITVESVQRILQLAREHFEFTVADLEDVEHPEQLRTLAVSDRIVMPLRPDYIALTRCKRFLDHLVRAKIPVEQISIVVNRTGQPCELPPECMAEALGVPLPHCIPNDPEAVCSSYNLGIPVVVSAATSPAAVAIQKLACDLVGEAEPEAKSDHSPTSRFVTAARRLAASFLS